jgi:hypothetical protein
MANNKIIAKFQLDGVDKATNNIGELERSLEQARQEIKNVEIGSDAFEDLARKIQTTESRVKTLNKQMEGLEPQQKAEAFLKMGEGIAGGFAMAQGAMSLLNIESENLEKLQVGVQSAISIAVGMRMVSEGALNVAIAKRIVTEKLGIVTTTLYDKITKVATISTKSFARALAGLGIGVIVGFVTTLVTKLQSLSKEKSKNAREVKNLKREYEDYQKALEDSNRELDIQLNYLVAMAKAQNDNERELVELERNLKINDNALQDLNKQYSHYQDLLTGSGKLKKEEKKDYEDIMEMIQANIDVRDKEMDRIKNRIADIEIQRTQEAQLEADRTKRRNKRKQEEKEEQDLIDKGQQISYDLSKELMFMSIEDANVLKANRLEIERMEALESVALFENKKELQDKINQKYDLLQKQRIEENAKYEADVEKRKYQELANMVGGLSGLFKQGSKQWKQLKIAEALITTYAAVNEAMKSTLSIPILGIAAAPFQMALALANGMAQVRAIKNTPIPEETVPVTVFAQGGTIGGYGTGTTDNIPVMASAGEVIINSRSAQMYRPLLSSINQAGGGIGFAEGGQIGGYDMPDMSNQIVKAYVVTDEMTESQDLLAKIRKRATL